MFEKVLAVILRHCNEVRLIAGSSGGDIGGIDYRRSKTTTRQLIMRSPPPLGSTGLICLPMDVELLPYFTQEL